LRKINSKSLGNVMNYTSNKTSPRHWRADYPVRRALNLSIPCGTRNSSEWRQKLQPLLNEQFLSLQTMPVGLSWVDSQPARSSAWHLIWEGVCVHQGAMRLTISARSLKADAYLRAFSDHVYRAVASLLEQPAAALHEDRRVGFQRESLEFEGAVDHNEKAALEVGLPVSRSPKKFRWVVPTLVVHKPGGKLDEAGWREQRLTLEYLGHLRDLLIDGIFNWAWEFGAAHPCIPPNAADRTAVAKLESRKAFAPMLDLKILSEGRPMPLKNAIASGSRSVSPYARLNVQFTTRENLAGMQAGLLQGLGYGQIWSVPALRRMSFQYPSVDGE
jgi:hypothetical protein